MVKDIFQDLQNLPQMAKSWPKSRSVTVNLALVQIVMKNVTRLMTVGKLCQYALIGC